MGLGPGAQQTGTRRALGTRTANAQRKQAGGNPDNRIALPRTQLHSHSQPKISARLICSLTNCGGVCYLCTPVDVRSSLQKLVRTRRVENPQTSARFRETFPLVPLVLQLCVRRRCRSSQKVSSSSGAAAAAAVPMTDRTNSDKRHRTTPTERRRRRLRQSKLASSLHLSLWKPVGLDFLLSQQHQSSLLSFITFALDQMQTCVPITCSTLNGG